MFEHARILFCAACTTLFLWPAYSLSAAELGAPLREADLVKLAMIGPAVAPVKKETPGKALVTDAVLSDIRSFVENDIVRLSVINQNKRYAGLTQADIDALDTRWRAEIEAEVQPLISATLSNPLSSYLTRVQAHSIGLYSEIFVMDNNGLNVGQSNISSDYWQGDEGKFQKTFPISANAVFVDDPEFNDSNGTWRVQVNLTVADGDTAIGAITVEVNLTELKRRAELAQN